MRPAGLGAKSLEYLIKSGAFDVWEITRNELVDVAPSVLKQVSRTARDSESALFSMTDEMPNLDFFRKSGNESLKESDADRMRLEKEATDLYLTRHPLDAVREKMAGFSADAIESIGSLGYGVFIAVLDRIRVIQTRSGSMMTTAQITDDQSVACNDFSNSCARSSAGSDR